MDTNEQWIPATNEDTGLSVTETVDRLTNYYYVERELVHLSGKWLAQMPDWEIKIRIGEFLREDAIHANLLRERLKSLRCFHPEPVAPNPNLAHFLDQLHALNDPIDFLVAAFQCLKGALLHTYGQYCRETDPLMDAPTERMLRQFIEEENRHLQWVGRAIDRMVDTNQKRGQAKRLRKQLKEAIKPLGDLGKLPLGEGLGRLRPDPILLTSVGRPQEPMDEDSRAIELTEGWHRADKEGWLDRFDEFATTGEALMDADASTWMLYEMANREMISAEITARNVYLFQDMPWEFLYQSALQVGDEVRHCEAITRWLHKTAGISYGMVKIDGEQVLELEELELFDRLVLYGHREEGNELAMNIQRAAKLAELRGPSELIRMFDFLSADEIAHLSQIHRWALYLCDDDPKALEKRLVEVLLHDNDPEYVARDLHGFDTPEMKKMVDAATSAFEKSMRDDLEEVLEPVHLDFFPVVRFERALPPSDEMVDQDQDGAQEYNDRDRSRRSSGTRDRDRGGRSSRQRPQRRSGGRGRSSRNSHSRPTRPSGNRH